MKRIALLVALVTLVGCSSGASKPKATTVARSTSASPSASTASVAQWGSMVATRQTPVLAQAAKIADCPIEDVPGDLTCGLGKLTFALTVETFGVYFSNASHADSLGPPPSEVSALVVETQSVVDGMKVADDARQAACVTKTAGTNCPTAMMAWESAKDSVLSTLNGWKPYEG
jgi:uncharacterized protein YceK